MGAQDSQIKLHRFIFWIASSAYKAKTRASWERSLQEDSQPRDGQVRTQQEVVRVASLIALPSPLCVHFEVLFHLPEEGGRPPGQVVAQRQGWAGQRQREKQSQARDFGRC